MTEPERAVMTFLLARFRNAADGRVAILPMERGRGAGFENEIQHVYLDCLAFGGKSTLDAIAIDLLYGDRLTVRGEFPIDLTLKVSEELQKKKGCLKGTKIPSSTWQCLGFA